MNSVENQEMSFLCDLSSENDSLLADRTALVAALKIAKAALLEANRNGWQQKTPVFAAINEAITKHGGAHE